MDLQDIINLAVTVIYIAIIINWYMVKKEIRSLGRASDWNHIRDFSTLHQLTKDKDVLLAKKAKYLHLRLITGLFVFIFSMILLFVYGGT